MGMKYAKLFKNNEFVIIPYQEYIDEYCGQIDIIKDYVNTIIFKQADVDAALGNIAPNIINH